MQSTFLIVDRAKNVHFGILGSPRIWGSYADFEKYNVPRFWSYSSVYDQPQY